MCTYLLTAIVKLLVGLLALDKGLVNRSRGPSEHMAPVDPWNHLALTKGLRAPPLRDRSRDEPLYDAASGAKDMPTMLKPAST